MCTQEVLCIYIYIKESLTSRPLIAGGRMLRKLLTRLYVPGIPPSCAWCRLLSIVFVIWSLYLNKSKDMIINISALVTLKMGLKNIKVRHLHDDLSLLIPVFWSHQGLILTKKNISRYLLTQQHIQSFVEIGQEMSEKITLKPHLSGHLCFQADCPDN